MKSLCHASRWVALGCRPKYLIDALAAYPKLFGNLYRSFALLMQPEYLRPAYSRISLEQGPRRKVVSFIHAHSVDTSRFRVKLPFVGWSNIVLD